MRDLVMHLHADELLNVQWTREIEAEWSRNVVGKQGAEAEGIQGCLRGMRDAVDGWEVTAYAKHIPKFDAVEKKDRHVAAAAYKLSLDDWPDQPVALVTKNVKDFPAHAFSDTRVTCYSLSGYIDALYASEPERVARVAEGCRKKLKAPALDRERYVAVLMTHGCVGTAQGLASLWGVECPVMDKYGTMYYESDSPKGKVPSRQSAASKAVRKPRSGGR